MNKIKIVLPFTILFFMMILSCESRSEINSNEQQKQQENISLKLTGQLYFFAPEFDSVNCKATGACDCCSSHALFINDSQFIAANYCTYDFDYYKGEYEVINDVVYFYCDSINVDKAYFEEPDTINKNRPDYVIKTDVLKRPTLKWTKFVCRNNICFKTNSEDKPYASSDNDFKEKFIKAVKQDSIDLKLGVNL